jgi:hypothetical protein
MRYLRDLRHWLTYTRSGSATLMVVGLVLFALAIASPYIIRRFS